MAALNGDKARFNRERRAKLARRERCQAIRRKAEGPYAAACNRNPTIANSNTTQAEDIFSVLRGNYVGNERFALLK